MYKFFILFGQIILVNITTTPIQCSTKAPNPAQKRFNTLTKGLQRDKAQLHQWLEAHSQLKTELAQKIIPLSQEINAMQLNMLIMLDQYHSNSNTALTVKQQEKLYTFIQGLADTCLCFDESGVAEEIHDRYNEMSVAEIKHEQEAMLKSGLEDLYDINLGEDFDFGSETAYADFLGAVNGKKKQRSSAQKKVKETKVSDNEIMENQSIKEIIRQLTKVLHPDREMDEAKKAQKSVLMQRANLAYKQNDLLALLELQFEREQFEQKELNSLANEKLLAYNRMLQRQRKQIKEEIAILKQRISHDIQMPPFYFYDAPEHAFAYLNQEARNMKASKSQLAEELEIFSDIKSLKRWLNTLKKSQMKANEHSSIDEIMEDLFSF